MLSNEVRNIATEFFRALDCPRSQELLKALGAEDYGTLAKASISPDDYVDPLVYFRDALAVSFLRKADFLPLGVDTAAAAKQLWYENEHRCFRTNRRLYALADLEGSTPQSALALEFFSRVKKKVHFLLGEPPTIKRGRFGPGSTQQHRGFGSVIPNKLSVPPTMTGNAWPFLSVWGETAWARNCSGNTSASGLYSRSVGISLDEVPGNFWESVHKTALIDRSIAMEPTFNGFYQLGVGDVMKQRLRVHGLLAVPTKHGYRVDLETDSQAVHRRLAREGSINGTLCTMDQTSASDLIAQSWIDLCTPYKWRHLWNSLRSPKTVIDGRPHILEKHSSMGNGYTFELETVMFLAIAMVVLEEEGIPYVLGETLSVYGDDLIAPTAAYEPLRLAFSFMGCIVNEKKSYHTGPFRESCGGDYFLGTPVRPIFLETDLVQPADFIVLANKLSRLVDYFPSMRRVRNVVLGYIPKDIRKCRGPVELGDIVIHERDRDTWQKKTRGFIRYVLTYQPVASHIPLVRWGSSCACTSSLYGVGPEGPTVNDEWRKATPSSHRISWVAYPG